MTSDDEIEKKEKFFKKWMKACEKAPNQSELKEKALQEMSKYAWDFDELIFVWKCASQYSKIRVKILQKIEEIDMFFWGDWIKCIKKTPKRSEIRTVMLRKAYKMAESAIDLHQLLDVYLLAPKGSELRIKVVLRLKSASASIDDWLYALESVPPESDLYETALEGAEKVARSFFDWKRVCMKAPEGSSLQKKALCRMEEREDDFIPESSSFFQWFWVGDEAPEGGNIQKKALERMLAVKSGYEDWYDALTRGGSSKFREKILLTLDKLEANHEFWLNLSRILPREQDHEELVLRKLKEKSSSHH